MPLVAVLLAVACGPTAKDARPPGAPASPTGTDTGTADADRDGYPAPHDCDDADSAVFPGAPDTWYDGVDANCDGADDYDADADGDAAAAWMGGDCDDADPTRSSLAARICGNGVDDDCDLEPDCDLRGDAMAEDLEAGTFTGATSAGGHVAVGDVTGDDIVDVLVTSSHEDTTWVFEGPLFGPARDGDQALALLPSGNGGMGLGDFDGDGILDVAATTLGIATETTTRIWTAGQFGPQAHSAQLVHADPFGALSATVDGADLDGDGIDELLIGGINGCDITGWDDESGCMEVFTGPIEGVFDDTAVSTMVVAEPNWAAVSSSKPGVHLDAQSDLTGDGLIDLALVDTVGTIGKFYVVETPLSAVVSLLDAYAWLVPPETPRFQLAPIASDVASGDVDLDGYDDLVLTSEDNATAPGLAWTLLGPIGPGELDTAVAHATMEIGDQIGNGKRVGIVGDVDGSGRPDVALEGMDTDLTGLSSWIGLFYDPVGVVASDLVVRDSASGPGVWLWPAMSTATASQT